MFTMSISHTYLIRECLNKCCLCMFDRSASKTNNTMYCCSSTLSHVMHVHMPQTPHVLCTSTAQHSALQIYNHSRHTTMCMLQQTGTCKASSWQKLIQPRTQHKYSNLIMVIAMEATSRLSAELKIRRYISQEQSWRKQLET